MTEEHQNTEPSGKGVRAKWVPPVFRLAVSGVVIALSLIFFICPAATICFLSLDPQLRATGQSRLVPVWFKSAAGRYHAWADAYLESDYAESLSYNDVAAAEWPMFGSVFFLVTADDLHRQGHIDASRGALRESVEKAAEIVASPVTATWVRNRWGDRYLETENVFYRMQLILGFSSYERITGSRRYHSLMSEQRLALATELSEATLHLRDDYPGECYPSDVLWAVAAIQRAAALDSTNHDELARSLMAVFDGQIKAPEGLPAFEVDSESGESLQQARGSGNSGILQFAAEIDPVIAERWYTAHEANFWKDTGWVVGFTEDPHGSLRESLDVDSGPVLFGFGSVASAFGIGAAKAVGRFDHVVPLTMEAVACAWPTPFGFLVPGLMGRLAADSWCLGEIALLFSMTRPAHGQNVIRVHHLRHPIKQLQSARYDTLFPNRQLPRQPIVRNPV